MKVLLLHAFPLDERMWEQQLESLRDYEVWAVFSDQLSLVVHGNASLANIRASCIL